MATGAVIPPTGITNVIAGLPAGMTRIAGIVSIATVGAILAGMIGILPATNCRVIMGIVASKNRMWRSLISPL